LTQEQNIPAAAEPAPDLLRQFLTCADPQKADRLLERLLAQHASIVVVRIVSSKVPPSAASDVQHDVLTGLIARLRGVKQSGDSRSIRDFDAYVAAAAYHACTEYYRERFPQRYSLRNRLRYLLRNHSHLDLWQVRGGEWICGSKEQRPAQAALVDRKEACEGATWATSREMSKLVENLLHESSRPVLFDELVEHIASQLGILDQPESPGEAVTHPSTSVETKLAQRGWLAHIWREISGLPLPQRIALLLSLRDDRGAPALLLLPVTGVASLRQIAALLEMKAEELAQIWNRLPLDDRQIGERLGLHRSRVANLRKAARERLRRKTPGSFE
jgi:DNA-directed RNA polymerase specialized sigma24 family protein